MPRDVVVVLDGYVLRLRRRDSPRIIERAHARAAARTTSAVPTSSGSCSTTSGASTGARSCAYRADRARLDADAARATADRSAATVADPTVAAGSRAAKRPARVGGRAATGCVACPRCAPRSSACGRCSAAPSWCTTCSGSRRSSARRRTACSPTRSSAAVPRARSATSRDVAWTEADLALVDEADALLGPPSAARPRRGRRGRRDAELEQAPPHGRRARAWAGTPTRPTCSRATAPTASPASADDDEPRTFGHVLVDEAQDLTPMQWRMLARRCPSGSMTLVGDFGQASRPGALVELGRRPRQPARARCRRAASRSRSTTARRPRSWTSPTGCCRPRRPASSPPVRSAAPAPTPRSLAVAPTSSSTRPARRGARVVDAWRHGRGDRTASSCTPRSPTRSPTSARWPTTVEAHRRARSRCSPASTPRASSSTTSIVVEPARARRRRPAGLRLLYVVAHPRHPPSGRRARRAAPGGARASAPRVRVGA